MFISSSVTYTPLLMLILLVCSANPSFLMVAHGNVLSLSALAKALSATIVRLWVDHCEKKKSIVLYTQNVTLYNN